MIDKFVNTIVHTKRFVHLLNHLFFPNVQFGIPQHWTLGNVTFSLSICLSLYMLILI